MDPDWGIKKDNERSIEFSEKILIGLYKNEHGQLCLSSEIALRSNYNVNDLMSNYNVDCFDFERYYYTFEVTSHSNADLVFIR